jgi:hypothetical protein
MSPYSRSPARYANPPHGAPRSTFQLQSRMCCTIASATMSRSVSVSGRRLLPTLNVSAKRTSRRTQFLSDGWSPFGHARLENETGTEVNLQAERQRGLSTGTRACFSCMTATKIAGEQYRRELAHSASSGDLRRGRGGCHDQNPARLSSVCLLGRVGHGDRARGSEPAHLRGWDLHQGASCNVTCQIFPPTSRHLPASIPDLIR